MREWEWGWGLREEHRLKSIVGTMQYNIMTAIGGGWVGEVAVVGDYKHIGAKEN